MARRVDKPLNLSVCYMVKNEAQFLEASLRSSTAFAKDCVIADTGSTDSTLQIIENFRDENKSIKVISTQWSDHFSKTRNEIAAHASEPWILFVDGDEVLDFSAYEILSRAIADNQIACYSLIQRNYTWSPDIEGVQDVVEWPPGLNKEDRPLYYFDNWMERLYKPSTGIQYEGRIHESLLPSTRRLGLAHAQLPLILHHFGRLKLHHEEKLSYYLKLVEKKCHEEPQNAAAWIEWMITLSESEEPERALETARHAVKNFEKEPEVLKSAYRVALRSEAFSTAEEWIHLFLKLKPNQLDALSHLTTAQLYQKKFDAVLHTATDVLKRDPKSFVVHVNLAVIYFEQKNWERCEEHLLIALEQKPLDSFLNEALTKVRTQIQRD